MSRFILQGPRPCTIFFLCANFLFFITLLTFIHAEVRCIFAKTTVAGHFSPSVMFSLNYIFICKTTFYISSRCICTSIISFFMCSYATHELRTVKNSQNSDQKHTTKTFAGFYHHSLLLTLCTRNIRYFGNLRNIKLIALNE